MRIGLIGAGRIGALHATTLAALPAVSGLVICDVDRSQARAVADLVGAVTADTLDGMLAAGVDAAVVATPTSRHAPLIQRIAAAGKPVFCEKPVAPDAAATRAVLDAVREAGVELQVGFQRRHDPGIAAIRAAITEGRLGRLHLLRSCTHDPAPPPATYVATSGGIFRDCAVHDFDTVRWVTGREVTEVSATGANRGAPFFAEASDVDTAAATLTLDDGTLAVCTATRYNGGGYDVRLEAHGSAGALAAGTGTACSGFADRFPEAYAAQLAAFCDLAAGTGSNPCSGEEALATLLVAEAAELSRRKGRPVLIEEVSR